MAAPICSDRALMDVYDFFERISTRYASETLGTLESTRSLHRSLRTEAVLELIVRHGRPGGTIADVGCGPGQLAGTLLARGFCYVGVDRVPAMFQATESALAGHPKASFMAGDAEDLPLKDEEVDVLALIGVIGYLRDDDAWLREARRVLSPGGIVIVSFGNLLNPAQALRAITRPVLGPLIRLARPQSALAQTLYASRIHHRPYVPRGRIARFRRHGFRPSEIMRQDFCMHIRARPLGQGEASGHLLREAWGARWVPWIGADVICCLERTG